MATSTPEKNSKRKWHLVPITLIVLGGILLGLYGVRTARSYVRIQQEGLRPSMTDVEAIRGWMTVPYIAKAYGVPADFIVDELNLPPDQDRDQSLRALNRTYVPDQPGIIVERVKAAIQKYQQAHPATPPTKP